MAAMGIGVAQSLTGCGGEEEVELFVGVEGPFAERCDERCAALAVGGGAEHGVVRCHVPGPEVGGGEELMMRGR